jgi:hypothetical protein
MFCIELICTICCISWLLSMGVVGSWFSIWTVRSCMKSCAVRVPCGLLEAGVEVVDVLRFARVAAVEEVLVVDEMAMVR